MARRPEGANRGGDPTGRPPQATTGVRMNYKSELRRLKRLLRADHEAYLDELDRPWPGMDEDLDLALKILLRHAARSGGRLPLIEAYHLPQGSRMSLVGDDLEHVGVVPGGLLAPAA